MNQRLLLGIFLAVCMALLAACGGNGASSGNGVVTKPTVTPTMTPTPQQVTVTVTDTSIHSSITTFTANTPYAFTVVNKGNSAHDFIINRTATGARAITQTTPKTLYAVASNKLTPGKTVSFMYQFPMSVVQQKIQFSEHLAGPSTGQGPSLQIQINK